MRRSSNSHRSTLSLVLSLMFAATSLSAASSLEDKNPFLPAGYGKKEVVKPQPVKQINGPLSRELEFRGYSKEGGTYEIAIFNKKEQKGYWLKMNETKEDIRVTNYNAETRSITVSMNGRTETLTIMSSSEAPLPVKTSVSTVQSNQNANSPNGLPASLKNTIQERANNTTNTNVPQRRRVILPRKN